MLFSSTVTGLYNMTYMKEGPAFRQKTHNVLLLSLLLLLLLKHKGISAGRGRGTAL